MYSITVLGIFSDRAAAIAFVRNMVKKKVEDDEDIYLGWLDEDDPNPPSREEFIKEQMDEFDTVVDEWRVAYDKPKPRSKDRRVIQEWKEARERFVWGIFSYIFTETSDYS